MSLGHSLADFVTFGGGTPKRFRVSSESRNNEAEAGLPVLRLVILRILMVGSFLLLLATLFRAQIFEGEYFRGLADGNRIREVVIHAPRGIIFDRNGVELTRNLPAFRFNGQTISKEQAIALEAQGTPLGQSLEVDSARSYVFDAAFSHLLGYVSEISAEELKVAKDYRLGDKIGRGGVEQQYERRLKGKDGKELVEVDAVGKKLRTVSVISAMAGEDLTLALDSRLQKEAYHLIEGKKAAIVVSDPTTGEILALASSPGYNPNIFTDFSLEAAARNDQVQALFADKSQPLFDRVVSGTYPPGSTFKIVTATAGLESGKITEATTIDDPGILVIGPYRFPNWKYLKDGGTQGVLNVVGAIQKSNDIFFYRTGEWVGIDGLLDWARRFNLSRQLGIDLPGESPGSLPTRKDWYLGDTYHLAIGQGDLLVTPLQVNAWTSVVANGGKLCVPSVVQSQKSKVKSPLQGKQNDNAKCKSIGISQKTLDLVKKGMIAACSSGGTAYPLFGMDVACKTGTAEFGDPGGRTHAWLTAFAPTCVAGASVGRACRPEIAVTVLVESGGEGSDTAAPIAKKVIEAWNAR